MRSYDDWIINGDWHKCECGRSWSDSDGGPCCSRCVKCGELFDNEEFDEDGNCKKCFLNNFSEGCVMTDLLTEEAAKLLNDVRLLVKSEDILSVSVQINSEAEYNGSGILIKTLKDKKKEVVSSKKENVTPLFEKYKEALGEYTPVEDALEGVIGSIELAGRNYRREAEEKARLAQLKLDEEARKAREKLIEAAETSEAKAAVMREEAEKLRSEGKADEADRLDRRADALCKKAEVKVERAQTIVAPTVAAVVPKNVRGAFNTRVYWKARVSDQKELLMHIISTGQYNLVLANMPALNGMAAATKGPSSIPGVQFYTE